MKPNYPLIFLLSLLATAIVVGAVGLWANQKYQAEKAGLAGSATGKLLLKLLG